MKTLKREEKDKMKVFKEVGNISEVRKERKLKNLIETATNWDLKQFIEFYLGAMPINALKGMCYLMINEIIKWEKPIDKGE